MKICDYKLCTGCMACSNACTKNAITFEADDSYKFVPRINGDMCIDCGACKRACPVVSEKKYNSSRASYAAGAKPGADIEFSSSAGVSAAFCEYVIEKGGVVFGAGFVDGTVSHICADTHQKAEQLRGSKYVRSIIGSSYSEAKDCLKTGKTVLFTGTPCQIAGLYGYLGKDYENLITADLICHGTPDSEFLNKYLEECGLSGITKISFRQRDKYDLTVYSGQKVIFVKNAAFDPYYRAFYHNLTLRENCYSCVYANVGNRPADISLGDFWGLDRTTLKTPIDGAASLILVNTEKGEMFLKNTGLACEERELAEAVNGNAQLKSPSKPSPEREIFLKNYSKGFIYAVNKTAVRKNIRDNKINYFKDRIKLCIKKALFLSRNT